MADQVLSSIEREFVERSIEVFRLKREIAAAEKRGEQAAALLRTTEHPDFERASELTLLAAEEAADGDEEFLAAVREGIDATRELVDALEAARLGIGDVAPGEVL